MKNLSATLVFLLLVSQLPQGAIAEETQNLVECSAKNKSLLPELKNRQENFVIPQIKNYKEQTDSLTKIMKKAYWGSAAQAIAVEGAVLCLTYVGGIWILAGKGALLVSAASNEGALLMPALGGIAFHAGKNILTFPTINETTLNSESLEPTVSNDIGTFYHAHAVIEARNGENSEANRNSTLVLQLDEASDIKARLQQTAEHYELYKIESAYLKKVIDLLEACPK